MCLLLLLQMTGTVAALVPNVSLLVESPRDSNCMTHSTRHIHYLPDFHSCPFRLVGDINVLEVSTLTDLSQPLTPRAPAASDMGITADLLPPACRLGGVKAERRETMAGFSLSVPSLHRALVSVRVLQGDRPVGGAAPGRCVQAWVLREALARAWGGGGPGKHTVWLWPVAGGRRSRVAGALRSGLSPSPKARAE